MVISVQNTKQNWQPDQVLGHCCSLVSPSQQHLTNGSVPFYLLPLRQKWRFKFAFSHSHRVLTPGWPVPALLLLQCSQLYLWGSPCSARFLHMWPFFQSSHRGSHIPSSWMVHAGCVFVALIHPSRTWISRSSESVWWNACVHRPDLSIYSNPTEFLGNWILALTL